jgi:hypothetical protein
LSHVDDQQEFPLVYIVILNWNGWGDTIECLESVFRINYPRFRVIVCDNDSTDNSLGHVKAWAEGRLSPRVAPTNPLRRLSFPSRAKPVAYCEYYFLQGDHNHRIASKDPLVLIGTGANLGFAGGNNAGIRYALADGDCQYVWLLNNDTAVEPDALLHLVQRMQEKPDAGICGSKLLFYHNPDAVQALGGATYNKWLGSNRHLGLFQNRSRPVVQEEVERKMSYVIGASMLVKRDFLKTVGLMSEEYFLYFEELDWIARAKGRFSLAFADRSLVYHKEGGSAGTSSDPKQKSLQADYFTIRNRLVFTRKFYPWALPGVYVGICVALINRLRRGQLEHAKLIGKILLTCGNNQGANALLKNNR